MDAKEPKGVAFGVKDTCFHRHKTEFRFFSGTDMDPRNAGAISLGATDGHLRHCYGIKKIAIDKKPFGFVRVGDLQNRGLPYLHINSVPTVAVTANIKVDCFCLIPIGGGLVFCVFRTAGLLDEVQSNIFIGGAGRYCQY